VNNPDYWLSHNIILLVYQVFHFKSRNYQAS